MSCRMWLYEDYADFEKCLALTQEWPLAHAMFLAHCRRCRHDHGFHWDSGPALCEIPGCACDGFVSPPPHPSSRMAAREMAHATATPGLAVIDAIDNPSLAFAEVMVER